MARRRLRVGFIMDQVAGHVTAYRNLRSVAEGDDEIEPVWREIHYFRPEGRLERFSSRFPDQMVRHPVGAVRGLLEQRRALRRSAFDVIMTNTTTAYLTPRWLRGTPCLFDFDSTPLQLERMGHYSSRPDPAPVTALKRRLTRRLYATVTVNQAWTTWARRSVIDDYGIEADRVVVNPPGVDVTRWTPTNRAGRSETHVLFVGGDFERKGGPDLLAWHRSVADCDVTLHVVSNAHVPAHDGVVVHRGVSPNSPELRELHRIADVFVLPSRAECFGIATVEAMASGLPVVVSDVGGTSDIVDHGRSGYIVPAGDERALGGALQRLLDDDVVRREMGANGRAIAEDRFDLRSNALVTLERLKGLAAR